MALPRKIIFWILLCCLARLALAVADEELDTETGVRGASEAGGAEQSQSASVKKDLKVNAPPPEAPPPPPMHTPDESPPEEQVVVISERNLAELQAEAKRKAVDTENKANKEVPTKESNPPPPPPVTTAPVVAGGGGSHQVHVEESSFKQKSFHMENNDMDLDSFQTGFYFFVGLSSAAILFIVFKVYRLRLSRAERKYGVQGDRSTQELTPLPISIEDGNSDEDDQTLFEINRQQIRIL